MGALKKLRRRLRLNRGALKTWLPRHLQAVLRYQSCQGEFSWLLRPRTFNQKLFYKMLYDRRPLLATFADKLLVREYVRQKVGGEILVNLLAVTDRPEEIDFEKLPRQFVLKANHGSGYFHIVMDKSVENETTMRQACAGWLSENYGEKTGEWVYKKIPPKIMVEALLIDHAGEPPCDYRFFMCNGKTAMIEVDMSFTEQPRDLFTPDWQRLDVSDHLPGPGRSVPQPALLDQMMKIAERLSAEVDFVRVDLYEADDRVFFGELTNFPGNGAQRFNTRELDAWLGSHWRIEGY